MTPGCRGDHTAYKSAPWGGQKFLQQQEVSQDCWWAWGTESNATDIWEDEGRALEDGDFGAVPWSCTESLTWSSGGNTPPSEPPVWFSLWTSGVCTAETENSWLTLNFLFVDFQCDRNGTKIQYICFAATFSACWLSQDCFLLNWLELNYMRLNFSCLASFINLYSNLNHKGRILGASLSSHFMLVYMKKPCLWISALWHLFQVSLPSGETSQTLSSLKESTN